MSESTPPSSTPPRPESLLKLFRTPDAEQTRLPGAAGDLARILSEGVPLEPGAWVGAYRVLRLLGQGGMGEVYEVVRGQERLALKLLQLDLAGSSEARARFSREATALASLQALGLARVVSVLERGETENGRPYFVMDLVSGRRSLRDCLKEGRLEASLEFLEQTAETLAAAHAHGLVHRDVKPENVLVDEEDQAYLVDFGLARHYELAESLTATGEALGTLSYMAPEQARGDRAEVSPKTDVFALGLILYEILTRERLKLTFYQLHDSQLPEFARPREINPDLDPQLEAVCLKAMAWRPDDRYQDAGVFLAALRATRRPAARSAVLLIAAALALSLAGLAAFTGWESQPPRPSRTASETSQAVPSVAPTSSPEVSAPPRWLQALPTPQRPPWPLPAGLVPTRVPGEVLNLRDGSRLRWVPPGTFRYGSDEGNPDEAPERDRELAGFFIGTFEVSWAQYLAFTRATSRRPPSRTIDGFVAPFEASEDHPVFNVTWHEAEAYCEWAGLELPTEEEWERAARGTDGRTYPWGDTFPPPQPTCNLADESADGMVEAAWGRWEDDYQDNHFFPAPVGSFPPGLSPAGCHDMAGNVWEWTQSRAEGGKRICRGGAWDNPAFHCRTTNRGEFPSERRATYLGFRTSLRPVRR